MMLIFFFCISFDSLIPTEDTTPGKPEFSLLKDFSNAILVGWQPPENAGLVCITGYKIEWGENSPYQVNVDLSKDKTQYLIKGLSKYTAIFIFYKVFFDQCCEKTGLSLWPPKPLTFCRNVPRKFPQNRLLSIICFSAKFVLKIFCEFPVKSAVFPSNLSLKILRNLAFSVIYQKP